MLFNLPASEFFLQHNNSYINFSQGSAAALQELLNEGNCSIDEKLLPKELTLLHLICIGPSSSEEVSFEILAV